MKKYLITVFTLLVTALSLTSVVKADERSELKKEKVYVAADAGVGFVSLGWSKSEKAVKYRIFSGETEKGAYKPVKNVKAKKTACTITVSAEKGYYYKVRPIFVLSDGTKVKGKKSDAVYARSFDDAPALSVDVVKKGYRIRWTPVTTYDGYMIYAAYDDTEEYSLLKTVKKPAKKKFVDKYVEPGTDVSYKICGYYVLNGKKITGPLSDEVSVKADGSVSEGTEDTGNTEPVDGTVSGNAVSGNTVSGNAVSGNAVSGNVVSGNTVSGNTVSGDNAASSVITFNTRTFLLGVGESLTVNAVSSLSSAEPVYTILDKTIAKVDDAGVITGLSPGSTKVLAEIDGERATAMITVTDCAINGIDISKWQGDDVDFEKIKTGGVSFVVMRISYHLTKDTRFEKYYDGATAAGLKRGVYCYSMAKSVTAARKEADNIIEILDGRQLDYPIAMDLEDQSQLKGLSNADRTDMILAFKNRIEAAGYSFVLYANLNWLNNYVDNSKLSDVNIWIARYRTQSYGHGYTGKGNVVMWQYASNGSVDGILDTKGKYIAIDMDVCYTTEFPMTYDPLYDPPAEDASGNDGDETGDTGNTENTDNTDPSATGDGTGDTGENTGTGDTENTGDTDSAVSGGENATDTETVADPANEENN